MPFLTGQIGGNIGIAGATVNLTGAATISQTSAADGSYLFTGLPAGSFTVTPTLAGYVFTPLSQNQILTNGQHALSVNFTVALAVWSEPDCRQAVPGFGPAANGAVNVQGTQTYTVQTSDNPSVPGTDSRVTKPTDDRVALNIPENSRNAPPF